MINYFKTRKNLDQFYSLHEELSNFASDGETYYACGMTGTKEGLALKQIHAELIYCNRQIAILEAVYYGRELPFKKDFKLNESLPF